MDSNQKGAIAEAKIAAEALALGIPVLKPVAEHGRYDLAFDLEGELLRVQCKWGTLKDGVVKAHIGGSRHSPRRGYVLSTYSATEIDAVAIYEATLERFFLVPGEVVEGLSYLHLRIDPPKNNQRGAINWASGYELWGCSSAGRATRWQRVGRGFESPQLHSSSGGADRLETVGAHDFRNRFGWYIQRAAAGESFEVTRRGKPLAHLSPPNAQLPLANPPTVRLTLLSAADLVARHARPRAEAA